MMIGIVIYSQTGNTRNVAEKLKIELAAAGHTIVIEEVTIEGKLPAQPGQLELKNIPNVDSCEAVIFGAPVQALSLNPVMKKYMEQLHSLIGKKVVCFVTKQIPLLWFGGTGAVSTMKKICSSKGADVIGTEIVVWAESKRERSIRKCVDSIVHMFNQK